ncbi:hypothetical protein GCM10027568_33920 [Humibacter soli]
MSDDIVISGGGSTQVAPDLLLGAERGLVGLAAVLSELIGELAPAQGLMEVPDTARLVGAAVSRIDAAYAQSQRLSGGLRDAAERYGSAERASNSFLTRLSEVAGWALGGLAPIALLVGLSALPGILSAAVTMLGVSTIATGSPQAFLRDVGGLMKGRSGILRDPRMVALIRLAVSAADNALLGAAGVPLPVARLLDDRLTGLFGLHGAATTVVAGASVLGSFRESPVHVERSDALRTAPPASYEDLARRIPPTRVDAPQVRVERYLAADDSGGGKPVFLVYVGGTVDTSTIADDEPFDLTSDLTGIAGLGSGSLTATESAMEQAGVQRGDTVIPVGYSQGGIVATSIATSGRYDVPTLVTFGSPTGGVDVPSSTADVAVEHTDDLVPALGGEPREFGNGGGDRVVVTRQTYDGEIPAGSSPSDAHRLSEYATTARRMDASTDPRLASALAALPIGADGDVGLYRGIRD